MVAGCINDEGKFAVGVDRLWTVLRDDHIYLPKMVPDHVASMEIIEGDGGPGTLKKITFTPDSRNVATYVKRRLVMLDETNRVFKYEVLEGGVSERIKSQAFEFAFESTGDGTCVVRLKVEYETVDDEPLDAGEQKKLILGPFMLFRGVEQYLLANPGA